MSGFRNDELVTIDGRAHPLVGGRLRLAHEANERITVKTEVLHFVLGVEAVVRCELTTMKGLFSAVASASAARDGELAEAVLEVAETRSLARALRWAGYSTEVGAEELGRGHAPDQRPGPVPIRRDQPGPGNRQQRSGPPASGAQLRCIRTLARRLGREVDDAVADLMPGLDLAHLSLHDASKVIDALKSAIGETSQPAGRRAP